jgi:hypothetical protein
MASIEDKIRLSASRNSELLRILSETDHAPPALEQQRRYIEDLRQQSTASQKNINKLDKLKEKEFKEHKAYRDSVMRRFAYKVSGKKEKFAQQAAKEEEDYFRVLQDEFKAKEMHKDIERMLAEALQVKQGLEEESKRHQEAQNNLDALYDSIFQGPSPGFSEEDDLETMSQQALEQYHQTSVAVETEDQAAKTLGTAQRTMQNALNSMQDALQYSRMDMWGGGTFTDMMERNALSQAEQYVMSAHMLVLQAQRLSPLVRDLPPARIAQGNLMSDVFFDNIFTDMAFHDKIKASNMEVEACARALAQNVEALQRSQRERLADLKDKAKRLEESRVALQKAREAAFQSHVGPSS